MKRIMFVGTTGVGKTSLMQALQGQELIYKKTQSLVFEGNYLDTPGEYLDNKFFKNSLLISCGEAEVVILLQSAIDSNVMFQPMLASMFNDREVIGVITKIDLENKDIERAKDILEYAGCEKIFLVSSKERTGIKELLDYLNS